MLHGKKDTMFHESKIDDHYVEKDFARFRRHYINFICWNESNIFITLAIFAVTRERVTESSQDLKVLNTCVLLVEKWKQSWERDGRSVTACSQLDS